MRTNAEVRDPKVCRARKSICPAITRRAQETIITAKDIADFLEQEKARDEAYGEKLRHDEEARDAEWREWYMSREERA